MGVLYNALLTIVVLAYLAILGVMAWPIVLLVKAAIRVIDRF